MGSIGEVHEDASMDPSCGNLSFWELSVLCFVSIRVEQNQRYVLTPV